MSRAGRTGQLSRHRKTVFLRPKSVCCWLVARSLLLLIANIIFYQNIQQKLKYSISLYNAIIANIAIYNAIIADIAIYNAIIADIAI